MRLKFLKNHDFFQFLILLTRIEERERREKEIERGEKEREERKRERRERERIFFTV